MEVNRFVDAMGPISRDEAKRQYLQAVRGLYCGEFFEYRVCKTPSPRPFECTMQNASSASSERTFHSVSSTLPSERTAPDASTGPLSSELAFPEALSSPFRCAERDPSGVLSANVSRGGWSSPFENTIPRPESPMFECGVHGADASSYSLPNGELILRIHGVGIQILVPPSENNSEVLLLFVDPGQIVSDVIASENVLELNFRGNEGGVRLQTSKAEEIRRVLMEYWAPPLCRHSSASSLG